MRAASAAAETSETSKALEYGFKPDGFVWTWYTGIRYTPKWQFEWGTSDKP
jgi:hypothetical protein